MKQNIKIGLAVIAGFVLGFTIAKGISKAPKSEETLDLENEEVENEPSSRKYPEEEKLIVEDSFPLKLGSKGDKVKRLQIFLMRQLGWVRQPNGEFDLLTKERTLKYFKQDHISEELFEKLMLDKMVHDQRIKRAS